jgi:phosphoesterase RecJ-like protein
MVHSFAELGHFFRQHNRFLIISHTRPDGDAYGSMLGLALSLEAAGKNVVCVNHEGLLPGFSFLPGSEKIKTVASFQPEADRQIVAVDTGDLVQLGSDFTAWNRPVDANLDHHRSNPGYGKINCILPDCPATAQLVFELIESEKMPLNAAVAANLFVGLSTDTGSFRHRNTSQRSFEIAARLAAAGADTTALAQNAYNRHSVARLHLLREMLGSLKTAADGKIVYMTLTEDHLKKSGATKYDSRDMIEYLQSIGTAEVCFILETFDPAFRRVSLRSREKVDVSKIATRLGGGGHKLAAGIRSTLPAQELEQKLLALIQEQI